MSLLMQNVKISGLLAVKSSVSQFVINQSLLLNDDDNPYLSWTPTSAGDRSVFTISVWVKRGNLSPSSSDIIFYQGSNNLSSFYAGLFFINDQLSFENWETSYQFQRRTNRLFRDPSAYYHIVAHLNTNNPVVSERVKIWVNGVEETSFSNSVNPGLLGYQNNRINTANVHYIGRSSSISNQFDGYLSDFYFIDGQALTPTDFGEFDADNNWKAKDFTGTFGTNGFHLDFANPSNLGEDRSGNNNDWTTTNITTSDQVSDSPSNNLLTLSPLEISSVGSLKEGNTQFDSDTTPLGQRCHGTHYVSSGRWYFEWNCIVVGSEIYVGITSNSLENSFNSNGSYVAIQGGTIRNGATNIQTGLTALTNGDVVGVALDLDANTLQFYLNNVAYGTSISIPSGAYTPYIADGGSTSVVEGKIIVSSDDWTYAAPLGHQELSIENIRAQENYTINKPSDYFDVITYTGDGVNPRSITGLDFQPDLVWIKNRSDAFWNSLWDSTRGTGSVLHSNNSNAEGVGSDGVLTSFDGNGFTIDTGVTSDVWTNEINDNYVAWCWRESNTTGFDIVGYTGNGSARTINHNLGQTPEMMILKDRTTGGGTNRWIVYHKDIDATPENNYLHLDGTEASLSSTVLFNNTAPTSTNFSVGASTTLNTNTNEYIAYLFSSIPGLIKVGSYEGNGSSNGPFVYTGFKPRYLMVKSLQSSTNWLVVDTERDGLNVTAAPLSPNVASVENTFIFEADFLSNGFKIRNSGVDANGSGQTIIFLAVAEDSQMKLAH